MPSKFVSFPKYGHFTADKKYAEIAAALGMPSKNTEEGTGKLINAVKKLIAELDEPLTFAQCGINEEEYMKKISDIANKAFEDQCTTANPRLPLVTEIEQLMKIAYYGE